MFQHYKSVFQLSPPRAPSLSLSHTGDNVLLSVSLGRALRSLAVNLNGLAVCMGHVCIVIHPLFSRAGMGSVRRFVHKQNFLLLEGFLDLFSVIWREAFFFGDLLCLRRWVFETTSFNF